MGHPWKNIKMDIIEYTDNEIRKNLALLENHLKQAPFSAKLFCEECINKHLILIEGLAEEGMTACIDCDAKKYGAVINFVSSFIGKDYQKDGIELAKQTRRVRKNFIPCDQEGIKDVDDIKQKINSLIEDLHAAEDKVSQDRIQYGIYLLQWAMRGKKCGG